MSRTFPGNFLDISGKFPGRFKDISWTCPGTKINDLSQEISSDKLSMQAFIAKSQAVNDFLVGLYVLKALNAYAQKRIVVL